jgi:hypothetical protein
MGTVDRGVLSVARFVWDTVGFIVFCFGWALALTGIAFAYEGLVNGIGLSVMLVGAAFLIWQSGRLRRRSSKWETVESRE